MLTEAKKRIAEKPDLYLDHVYGEHEAGGTSVLNISNVDIELPDTVPTDPLHQRTWGVLKTVPLVFVGMGAAMLGLRWIVGRRDQLQQEKHAAAAGADKVVESEEGEA